MLNFFHKIYVSKKIRFLLGGIIILLVLGNIKIVFGATANELKNNIQSKTSQIDQLEKEIKQLNNQLDITGKEKTSLQSTLKTLDITDKKLSANLKITQTKISATDLNIQKLGLDINSKQNQIDQNKTEISAIFRKISESDSISLLEIFLTYGNTSTLWNDIESLNQLKNELNTKTRKLSDLKASSETDKKNSEVKKQQLVTLKNSLSDQKAIASQNIKDKNTLLSITKNKESNYQKNLEVKKLLQQQFQNELFNLESQLKEIVNTKTIPAYGTGILSWPIDVIKITQKFGYTDFAKNNPVYNGNGHNGVDFCASVGTPIKASLTGTVMATGNTDLACPWASYGKWVVIKHYNGLSTLYAHLSLIKVQEGQSIQTSDLVGYSGNTGYTTGPHLHFTVFATDGISINTYKFKSCAGASIKMPVAIKQGAYLDPLKYL